MFGLTYLSNDRNKQLRKLQERLANAADYQVRNETNLLIQEIMAEAKPYQKCDIYEANELRNQLLDKMTALNRLGKAGSVEVFQMYIREIDFHIQTKQMEEAVTEKNRLKPDEGANLRDRTHGVNAARKEQQDKRRKEQAKGRTRWVIGMDEEDE